MLLGIDVGGTFTDAVLVEQGTIVAMAKAPTTHQAILQGILRALDKVLVPAMAPKIERVVISSTIVTNAIAEGQTEPVFLAIMPGPGLNPQGLFPIEPYLAKGYVDHRGQIIVRESLELARVDKMAQGKKMAAVSGKFAVRNQSNEVALASDLQEYKFNKIFVGSQMSGELNFVRRTNSAYFSAAVYHRFKNFVEQVEASLTQRQIIAPIHVLKADGGTLPLAAALEQPIEGVFTGPAASVLGIEAIDPPEHCAISLDVGGTTTDIAFWEDGKPLMARKGAKVAGYNTSVRAFHMRSLGIGGDSAIVRAEKGFDVGPERAGQAAALGGDDATLADALITAGRISFGDATAAREAIATYCHPGECPEKIAVVIIDAAVTKIAVAINEMLQEWSMQPVYTVDDIVQGSGFVPQRLIGVGGGAPGLIAALGEKMHLPVEIPQGAMVANAIGAALAKPTLTATLRCDTTEGYYLIPEAHIKEKISKSFGRRQAEEVLREYLLAAAGQWQMEANKTEIIAYEEFPTIHNYVTSGKIIYAKMQLQPGILFPVVAREVAF